MAERRPYTMPAPAKSGVHTLRPQRQDSEDSARRQQHRVARIDLAKLSPAMPTTTPKSTRATKTTPTHVSTTTPTPTTTPTHATDIDPLAHSDEDTEEDCDSNASDCGDPTAGKWSQPPTPTVTVVTGKRSKANDPDDCDTDLSDCGYPAVGEWEVPPTPTVVRRERMGAAMEEYELELARARAQVEREKTQKVKSSNGVDTIILSSPPRPRNRLAEQTMSPSASPKKDAAQTAPPRIRAIDFAYGRESIKLVPKSPVPTAATAKSDIKRPCTVSRSWSTDTVQTVVDFPTFLPPPPYTATPGRRNIESVFEREPRTPATATDVSRPPMHTSQPSSDSVTTLVEVESQKEFLELVRLACIRRLMNLKPSNDDSESDSDSYTSRRVISNRGSKGGLDDEVHHTARAAMTAFENWRIRANLERSLPPSTQTRIKLFGKFWKGYEWAKTKSQNAVPFPSDTVLPETTEFTEEPEFFWADEDGDRVSESSPDKTMKVPNPKFRRPCEPEPAPLPGVEAAPLVERVRKPSAFGTLATKMSQNLKKLLVRDPKADEHDPYD